MSRPKLRTIRKQQRKSLREMAEECQVSESYLSRFERGLDSGETLNPEIVQRISAAYGVRVRMVGAKAAR